MTGNRMMRNAESGKMEPKNASVDYCAQCTETMTSGGENARPQPPTIKEYERRPMDRKAIKDRFPEPPKETW